jgi:dTDP-4-amino-4,6-dideoxygalactose transaminase
MIHVTRTYLPDFQEYSSLLKQVWESGWITNNGALVRELEQQLAAYLEVPNLLFCANGTIVLDMALRALNITKEVITTPFSYVATTNAILWRGCQPVFVDIDPASGCIDPNKMEAAITENTQAILATHVYGIACDVEAIQKIADRYQLKVIYDAAHAFGVRHQQRSLLGFGDISTCSFHATKLFHTVEGGCLVCADSQLAESLIHQRQFGHYFDDFMDVGINAKNTEFHAAMGLCVLKDFPGILAARKERTNYYAGLFAGLNVNWIKPVCLEEYNYSYLPVAFESEEVLVNIIKDLAAIEIFPRRYFYPSLNQLAFIQGAAACPVSESLAPRVLCLPLYHDLAFNDIERIVSVIKNHCA